MSKIIIKTLEGQGIVIGDRNIITNTLNPKSIDKVLTRDEYFQFILELRDIERLSIAIYLEDKFQKYSYKNPDFVKILYKDINKVLEGVDTEFDDDLEIQNDDFVIEYGDIKLTGNPTNLHYALIWLHTKLIEILKNANPDTVDQEIDKFENDFLNINYNSPSYSKNLFELNLEFRQAKKPNHKRKWIEFNNFLELKPNIFGFGVNLNYFLKKFICKK